jgi:hypothetical protein
MKKLVAFMALLFLAGGAFASAQVVPGLKFELGTSVSYYNLKFDNDSENIDYLNVPVRFGWYVWNGFEIEPEVQFFIPMQEGGQTAYFLQAHLLYNFSLAGKIVPFLGGGVGVGNGLPFYGVIEGGTDYKTFGFIGMAGLKFMIGKAAAIRLEYRFNRFSWDNPLALEKEWGTLHNVLVGVSVFF